MADLENSVCIIIPTILDSMETLDKTLKSIRGQSVLPDQIVLAIQTFAVTPEVVEGLKDKIEKDKKLRKITSLAVTDTRGSSINRNVGLSSANSDIILFLDDDTAITDGAIAAIKAAYKEYPDSAAITFCTINEEGALRKKYPGKSFLRSKLSIMGVGAIEVTTRKKFLDDNNIRFNENFGIAAKFCTAEENIFLADILKNKGKIRFVPKVINTHPQISTGSIYNKNIMQAHGAALYKIFGLASIIMIPLFIAKKTLSGHVRNPLYAFYQMFIGVKDFCLIKNK